MSELHSWLSRLERLHPTEIELGLGRVAQVATTLGIEKPANTVITVAGTNGKGSCVATMEALLCADGRHVGAYSSPHLLRFNERIRIDGQEVDDASLVAAFEAIEQARDTVSLTYFEYTTLAALWLFQRAGVDYALLEVGLGGRLDAVNLVDPDLAIITSVALDHEEWLGSDREVIGREKAGILRPGVPFVCADPEPPASVVAAASGQASPACYFDTDFYMTEGAYRFGDLELVLPEVPLPPPSVAAALTALKMLDVLPAYPVQIISQLRLAGRCQQVRWHERELLLDVGHNPAAAAYLADWLDRHPVSGRTLALVAVMADKDLPGLFEPLVSRVDHWYPALLPDNPRAADGAQLQEALRDTGARGLAADCAPISDVLQRLIDESDVTDRLLVFGSFFTVAEVLQRMREEGDGVV